MGIYTGTIRGTIISRQARVGSRSEGPDYFILPNDEYKTWGEIKIRKKIMKWMKDPVLHNLIGEVVSLTGEIVETKDTITIEFTEVEHEGKIIPASQKSGKVVYPKDKLDEILDR
ncbi:MAG: hypothetical protein INQ03_15990 [Candidatus Heimdallarchaeota archaeon]|nr:hypothetical protein [Candidatus Heimdallarchaeota archaeon]